MQTPEDGAIAGMMDPSAEFVVLFGPKNSGSKGPAVPNPPKEYEADPKAIGELVLPSEHKPNLSWWFRICSYNAAYSCQ